MHNFNYLKTVCTLYLKIYLRHTNTYLVINYLIHTLLDTLLSDTHWTFQEIGSWNRKFNFNF